MNKRVIISLLGIFFLLITSFGCEKKEEPEKEECIPITGGSFVLNYETNGGKKVDSVNVCIACNPDTYAKLVKPTKKGYKFLGWFYDEELTKEVSGETTLAITPVGKTDENNCLVGYKDITIYAKWKKSK